MLPAVGVGYLVVVSAVCFGVDVGVGVDNSWRWVGGTGGIGVAVGGVDVLVLVLVLVGGGGDVGTVFVRTASCISVRAYFVPRRPRVFRVFDDVGFV